MLNAFYILRILYLAPLLILSINHTVNERFVLAIKIYRVAVQISLHIQSIDGRRATLTTESVRNRAYKNLHVGNVDL